MNKIIILIMLILIQACSQVKEPITPSSVLKKTERLPQRVALLIGISKYAGKGSSLKGIYQDIDKMDKLFTELGFKTEILRNSDASLNAILKKLDKYNEEFTSKDSFVFYFTGHGSYMLDKNNDEKDGRDEMLVLSNGKQNTPLLDDVLNEKLSAIKAKKLFIFDSCHSGTVSKASLSSEIQVKSISPKVVSLKQSKLEEHENIRKSNKPTPYIMLSAAQDSEQSLATTSGSVFTNLLYKAFTEEKGQSFYSLNKKVGKEIMSFCDSHKIDSFHPKISSSDSSLLEYSLEKYLSR